MVVETLESRCLLSVMPAPAPTVSDGILSVTGTAGDDQIRIRIIPHHLGISLDLDILAVKVNGTTTIFRKTSIQKIQINGLDGDDKIVVRRANQKAEIDGGAGNDTILGGAGDDLISGGAGKDILRGNGGDDVLAGGDGNDKIFGGGGNDSLLSGRGRDKLRGGGGSDMLDGAKSKHRLRGGSMNHSLPSDSILQSDRGDGGDDVPADVSGDTGPIWWDPEANTDDSGNPVDNPNIY